MYGIQKGVNYKFSVKAVNFNGVGADSDEVMLLSCTAPAQVAKLTRVASTNSSITVQWEPPHCNGGCPIIGYKVFIDDGMNGTFT